MNQSLSQDVFDQIAAEERHFAEAPRAFLEAWKRGAEIAGPEWFGDGTPKACSAPPASGICAPRCCCSTTPWMSSAAASACSCPRW